MRRYLFRWSCFRIGFVLLVLGGAVEAKEPPTFSLKGHSKSEVLEACEPSAISLIGAHHRDRLLNELKGEGWHLPSAEKLREIYFGHERQFNDGLFWVAPPTTRSRGFNWYYSVPRKQVMEFGDILSFPAFLLLVRRNETSGGPDYACFKH